jgi:hypothetical protein
MKISHLVWTVLCLGVFTNIQAQNRVNKDSLLANERALDRPLNVHGGQLRVGGSYGFSNINRRFGETSSSQLKTEGLARAAHQMQLDLKYGITEHLQLTVALGRQRENIKGQQQVIFGYPNLESITIMNTLTEVNSPEDLKLGLDYRLPFKTRKFDLMLSGAVWLPTAPHQTEQPRHTIKQYVDGWEIDYRYDRPIGRGATTYQMGAAYKQRFSDWGFTFQGHYAFPTATVTQLEWRHQLNNQNQFEHESSSYTLANHNELWLNMGIEWQASPYFNVFFELTRWQRSGGWYQKESTAYALQEQSATTLGPGFELIITPRLWFRETVQFTAAGKNIDAGPKVLSTLQYNLFVKK